MPFLSLPDAIIAHLNSPHHSWVIRGVKQKPELKQTWKKRKFLLSFFPPDHPCCWYHENTILKIAHFYPSTFILSHLTPSHPSLTSSSDVSSLGENTDTNTANAMSCWCCCDPYGQTTANCTSVLIQTVFFCANKVEEFPPFKINIGNKCPGFPTVPSNYQLAWPTSQCIIVCQENASLPTSLDVLAAWKL